MSRSSRPGDWPLESKVYVGGLPSDASAGELEDIFGRYGKLKKVWVARRPPGFAFLEYEDSRDAEDAVRALDGTRICGSRARVEMSNGKRRTRGSPRGGGYGGRDSDRGYDRDRRRTPPVRRRSYSRSRSPRGRSRSRSPRRSYSRSPPPRRDRSYSRSRSRS